MTVIRGRAGFKAEAVLTLDRQGMRLTHPRRSLEFDVAWPDVEAAEVIGVLKQNSPGGGPPRQLIASFRRRQPEPPTSLMRRLFRPARSPVVLVAGVFEGSPEELVALIERYRMRYGAPDQAAAPAEHP